MPNSDIDLLKAEIDIARGIISMLLNVTAANTQAPEALHQGVQDFLREIKERGDDSLSAAAEEWAAALEKS